MICHKVFYVIILSYLNNQNYYLVSLNRIFEITE